MTTITLLHGSDHIIQKPDLKIGKTTNDYGQGFYCTKNEELSKEWACKNNVNGYSNKYELVLDGLNILNLLDGSYNALNWIALLLKNRVFPMQNEIDISAKNYIINNYSIDTSKYDVIIGYRADDSYFSIAKAFVGNSLPLKALSKALYYGNLGAQVVLVTEKAFKQLRYLEAISVDKELYYPKFLKRDLEARKSFNKLLSESKSILDDLFIIDIIRGKINNNDTRIPRIISK